MFSNVFNYVAGAASIISLVIALTPYFPEYKGFIRYATVFFFGTLAGSLFATASSHTIVFQFEGTLIQMVLLITAIISLTIVVAVILSIALGGQVEDYHGTAAGAAATLFVAMILLYGITNLPALPIGARQRDADESLALARYHRQSNNLSQAMQYYCDAMKSVKSQPRAKEVADEVNALCAKP